MRILYSHYLADDDHPAAQMVRAIARELRGLGHELFVHRSAGNPSVMASPRPKRTSGSSRLRGALWFTRALARNRAMYPRDVEAIETAQPDVILARQDAYCDSMVKAASQAGIPLVTYADAPVAHETRRYGKGEGRFHPPGLVEAIERRTLRQSRAVITISEPAARLLGRYRVNTPIHVVSNGVAPDRFPVLEPSEREALRTKVGLTAPNVIGFAGTFKAFHGIDRLRDLIVKTAHRQDVQWLLIGDGPERAELQASLGGRARVVFLGRRPAEEMGRWMGLMDIAVAPHPQVEGEFYFCPLKILEYGAAGCCVLAGNQGDIPRLLDYGRAGISFAVPSPEAWARTLVELLDDPARRRKLGEAARNHVMSHYTWRRTAEQVETILLKATEPTDSHSETNALRPRDPASEGITEATQNQPLFSGL